MSYGKNSEDDDRHLKAIFNLHLVDYYLPRNTTENVSSCMTKKSICCPLSHNFPSHDSDFHSITVIVSQFVTHDTLMSF